MSYSGMILDGPRAGQYVTSPSAFYRYVENRDPLLTPASAATNPVDVVEHVLQAFPTPFVDGDGERYELYFFIDPDAAGSRPWTHVFTRLTEMAAERTRIEAKLQSDLRESAWPYLTAEEFLSR